MWPFKKSNTARALGLLDQAEVAADDIAYAELVCGAADIAESIVESSAAEAEPIWRRIAQLDGERARLWELVDRARVKTQSAGSDSPPTVDQDYENYLATLPEDQRCLTQVRYLHRLAMSGGAAGAEAASRGMKLLAEYEQTRGLTKKQAEMRMAFSNVLKRHT